MQRRRRQSLTDLFLVWGFVLSFVGLLVAGAFEAVKLVTIIPAAFESSPGVLQNPMRTSDDDYQANNPGQRRMTARERARYAEQAGQQ